MLKFLGYPHFFVDKSNKPESEHPKGYEAFH